MPAPRPTAAFIGSATRLGNALASVATVLLVGAVCASGFAVREILRRSAGQGIPEAGATPLVVAGLCWILCAWHGGAARDLLHAVETTDGAVPGFAAAEAQLRRIAFVWAALLALGVGSTLRLVLH